MKELTPEEQKHLDSLLAKRDEFLKEKPNMKWLQDEIDEILDKTPQENRAEVAALLLAEKYAELNKQQNKLLAILRGEKYDG